MPRPSLTRLFALHRLDKATADVGDVCAKLTNAEPAFQAAHLGPIREELAIADDKVQQAAAAASVIAAQIAKLRILAPEDGTIALLFAEPGEAVIPGQPVMTAQRGRDLACGACGGGPRPESIRAACRSGRAGVRDAAARNVCLA